VHSAKKAIGDCVLCCDIRLHRDVMQRLLKSDSTQAPAITLDFVMTLYTPGRGFWFPIMTAVVSAYFFKIFDAVD